MNRTIYVVVGTAGDARALNLTDAVKGVTRVAENEHVAIWEVCTGTARKVWHGTPEDARAGRGYVTEEPSPEIPPCKYPVGTVLQHCVYDPKFATVQAARLAWVYDYDTIRGNAPMIGIAETVIDQHYTVVPPDPYPVGSEHVVDLGLLGRQTAKVVHRDGDLLSFVVLQHQQATGVAFFEKAVVK